MLKLKQFKKAVSIVAVTLFANAYIDSLSAQTTVKYTYDELGRLTVLEDPVNGNRNYQLDKAGNRLSVTVGTQTSSSSSSAPSIAAPTGLFCNQVAPGAYRASWNPVPGATSYVYRSKEEREYTVTNPYQVTNYTCKWVKACTSPTNCSLTVNF